MVPAVHSILFILFPFSLQISICSTNAINSAPPYKVVRKKSVCMLPHFVCVFTLIFSLLEIHIPTQYLIHIISQNLLVCSKNNLQIYSAELGLSDISWPLGLVRAPVVLVDM